MRATRPACVLAGLAAAAAAAPALAGDEDLRRELEQTREQVRKLTQRVEELEGRGPGADVGRAVEEYLRTRGGPSGNVSAPGSASLKFSGHVLLWWEQLDGVYRSTNPAGIDRNDVGWLRTSLQADATIRKDLRARVEVRDARATGQEPSTIAQAQAPGVGLDLKQGWFEADDFAGSGVSLRAGRQTLSYGDERLLGENDWHTYGRSFDGVLLSRTFGPTKADLIAMRVLERGVGATVAGVDNDDQTLWGIYTQTPKALHHSDLDAYLLLLKDNLATAGEAGGMGNTGIATLGARLAGAKGNLDWTAETAIQRGQASGDRLRAWAAALQGGYAMTDTKWTPRLALEWDYATGDDDPTDGDRESFQALFPTNHWHHGIMDVAAWQNLQAWRAGVALHPSKEWTVEADWWRFYLEDSGDAWYAGAGGVLRPAAPGSSRYVGSEADLVLSWRPNDRMKVDFGGAQFFDGGHLRTTGGGNDALWLYFRIQVWF